jgi:hypothetical protein
MNTSLVGVYTQGADRPPKAPADGDQQNTLCHIEASCSRHHWPIESNYGTDAGAFISGL